MTQNLMPSRAVEQHHEDDYRFGSNDILALCITILAIKSVFLLLLEKFTINAIYAADRMSRAILISIE